MIKIQIWIWMKTFKLEKKERNLVVVLVVQVKLQTIWMFVDEGEDVDADAIDKDEQVDNDYPDWGLLPRYTRLDIQNFRLQSSSLLWQSWTVDYFLELKICYELLLLIIMKNMSYI